jgi:hypothetical protein
MTTEYRHKSFPRIHVEGFWLRQTKMCRPWAAALVKGLSDREKT